MTAVGLDVMKKRELGSVFTSLAVVGYILDEVGYRADTDLSEVSLLEPSAGNGSFAGEIIGRLFTSSERYGFDFLEALKANIVFVEIDAGSYQGLVNKLESLLAVLGFEQTDVLPMVCRLGNFLQITFNRSFDCVVGNPPYIRHERIAEEDKKRYRKNFATFKFRADLYIPFFEMGLGLLSGSGKLSFICSNRWLNNQYGSTLRGLIAQQYQLIKLLNIEKSSPFEGQVIAYPCIVTIAKQKRGTDLLFLESGEKIIEFSRLEFKKLPLPIDENWNRLFVAYELENDFLMGLESQDFKIGIGVATGADQVFIGSMEAFSSIESSRLLPILQSGALKGSELCWQGKYVINPYEDGHLCELDKFPNLKTYFELNSDVLKKRHTAKKSPRDWYKTIDRIKPDLLLEVKLLLPDLAHSKWLFIDQGNFYPHHNLYYVTGGSVQRLKLLACLLMSNFVREQLAAIGIRMNGGMPRLQSQTLKKLKIPVIDSFDAEGCRELVNAYDSKDLNKLNVIIDHYCFVNRIGTVIGEPLKKVI